MRNTSLMILALGVLSILFAGAEARPLYKKRFQVRYTKYLRNVKVTCNVCHRATQSKRQRNNYGAVFAKHLNGTNVKDVDRIDRALEATEKELSHVKDRTFGDLIHSGQLPAKPRE